MSTETNRRTVLAALAASGAALAVAGKINAAPATPAADDHDHDDHDHGHTDGATYLLAGDSETKTLTVYSVPDHTVIEVIEGVVVNSHAGTIPLPDGSVLLVDDEARQLLHIEIHGDHAHVHTAAVPGTVAHIAIESDHAHYCAVGTSGEDEHQLHLVNLESWAVTSLALPDAAEAGLMLTHDTLFHRNSHLNRVEAYNLTDLAEGNVEMLSYVDIGTAGHGEAINAETGELFILTDDGVDIVYWDEPALTFGKTLPWPASEPASRGYFCRLINNGSHLLTYTSDRSAPETEWNTWKNRVVIYDIITGDPMVAELPDGYTFRFNLADAVATFTVIGGDLDRLVTIDLDAASATFGQVVSTVSLPAMSGGATVGEAFYELGAFRASAILPDGSAAYVTRGGDGVIEVIDPLGGETVEVVAHASPLTGGGTLAVFGGAVPFTDTIGR